MCDGTSDPTSAPSAVVRARRFELLDDLGEVRAVLGNLAWEADTDYWPGLVLRDPGGRDRVCLMVHDMGPELEFNAEGSTVLLLGVHDLDSEAVAPGSHLKLCDSSGAVVAEWRVDPDGDLDFRYLAS